MPRLLFSRLAALELLTASALAQSIASGTRSTSSTYNPTKPPPAVPVNNPQFDVPASQGPTNAFPNNLITGTSTDASGNLTFVGISDVKAGDLVQGGLWVYGEYFPVSTSPQFTDVPSTNPFYDQINVIRMWSITQGCEANRYCPADPVTGGQMAVFLVRALLGDTFEFPTTTTYCPDNNVNRGEMAVFVVRAKLKPLLGNDFSFPATAYFTDVPAGHSFYKFVQKLRELGVTGGCSATDYCPATPITREQMAAFLTRGFLN